MQLTKESSMLELVRNTVSEAPILDVHTHLFSPCFGELLRTDPDSTITYHYLIEETVLQTRMDPAAFWKMPRNEQTELVWKTLFIDNPPVSESCKTILRMFARDGFDPNRRDLDYYRSAYAAIPRDEYIRRTFEKQHVRAVVMTNDPFVPEEAEIWLNGSYVKDPRFLTALRLDDLLLYNTRTLELLNGWGYHISADADGKPDSASLDEISRFIADWIDRTESIYVAASYPVEFSIEDDSAATRILLNCILPVCEKRNLPVSMMFGVTRRVNPPMGPAGDSLGKVDIRQLHKLFRDFPRNRFLITSLVRESQHEFTCTARIFNNVMLFGCWWFLNNPVLETEMTKIRYEMLGPKFIAQHSDANMIGHMTGKWERFKPILSRILCEEYSDLYSIGYRPDDEQIVNEISDLFGGYIKHFVDINV